MTDLDLIARAVRENRVHPSPSDVEAAAILASLAAARRVIVDQGAIEATERRVMQRGGGDLR